MLQSSKMKTSPKTEERMLHVRLSLYLIENKRKALFLFPFPGYLSMKVFIKELQTPVPFTNLRTILECLYHPVTSFSTKSRIAYRFSSSPFCFMPAAATYGCVWVQGVGCNVMGKSQRDLASASCSSFYNPEQLQKLLMLFSWGNREKTAANCCKEWCFIRAGKSLTPTDSEQENNSPPSCNTD